jgi:hypothetical protein
MDDPAQQRSTQARYSLGPYTAQVSAARNWAKVGYLLEECLTLRRVVNVTCKAVVDLLYGYDFQASYSHLHC